MSDKVVVITGASSGIGAALAALLGRRGTSVVLVARRPEALESIAVTCGDHALAIVADCTKRDDVRRVVDMTISRFGRIDVWVNNAGQGITRPPSQLTDEDIDEVMRQNVKTALYGMQEVLPHFKERNEGHIINVSSLMGRIPFPTAAYRAAYIGAKSYLNALTATFRAELQQTHPGVVVSIVSPGVVATDFGLHALHGGPDSRALPDPQSPEDAAAAIAGVIDSRKPDVYTKPGVQTRVAAYYASLGSDP
jgi:NADP-dependent 3-hydroxy acid dehydrogenase YdfG